MEKSGSVLQHAGSGKVERSANFSSGERRGAEPGSGSCFTFNRIPPSRSGEAPAHRVSRAETEVRRPLFLAAAQKALKQPWGVRAVGSSPPSWARSHVWDGSCRQGWLRKAGACWTAEVQLQEGSGWRKCESMGNRLRYTGQQLKDSKFGADPRDLAPAMQLLPPSAASRPQ